MTYVAELMGYLRGGEVGKKRGERPKHLGKQGANLAIVSNDYRGKERREWKTDAYSFR